MGNGQETLCACENGSFTTKILTPSTTMLPAMQANLDHHNFCTAKALLHECMVTQLSGAILDYLKHYFMADGKTTKKRKTLNWFVSSVFTECTIIEWFCVNTISGQK